MAKLVCTECGEVNEFDAEFCSNCNAFLAWDDAERQAGDELHPTGQSAPPAGAGAATDKVKPRFSIVPDPQAGAAKPIQPRPDGVPDPAAGRFRVVPVSPGVSVPASGEPVTLGLRVTNTSAIVDGYRVEAVGAPSWLIVESTPSDLLPNSEQVIEARLRADAGTLVPAQQLRVLLRVSSIAQSPAYADLPVEITVPVVEAPLQLRAEPRLIRLRDRDTAEFTLQVDNSGSNRGVPLQFSGSDPELAVQFHFEPAALEVPPGGSGTVRVRATAAPPAPGSEMSRILTVSALDGTRSVETVVTLQQLTSAQVEDPPVALTLEPSLVRVRDTTVGMVRLQADNRGGKQWAQLQLAATDPERVVRVAWALPRLDVPPGGTAYVDARLQAPLPQAGSEVSRTVTVTARHGTRTSTATATFVQVASASPMATLAIRTDPSVVRVQDADTATSHVVVDNRRGGFAIRVVLAGADPERAIRFTFATPVVDVPAGQAVSVGFQLDAWRPRPGQESSRPFTITASDGNATVETTGTLVQTTSRAAIETLAIRLDPSVLRLGGSRRGRLTAVVDNRNGAQPVQVSLRGDDPENSLGFAFNPPSVEIPPGRVARTLVMVKAPGAPAGQEINRPFMIMATDGQSEVSAEGSLIQTAAERRPLARVLFTLFGGLAMIIGGFLPFWSGFINADDGNEATAADLHANLVVQFFANANIRLTNNDQIDGLITAAAQLVSVALVMVLFAVVAIFGLTGPSGRLTRLAAFFGAGFVVVVFVAFLIGGVNGGINEGPGEGALLLLAGCVAAYIGGLLVRRR